MVEKGLSFAWTATLFSTEKSTMGRRSEPNISGLLFRFRRQPKNRGFLYFLKLVLSVKVAGLGRKRERYETREEKKAGLGSRSHSKQKQEPEPEPLGKSPEPLKN